MKSLVAVGLLGLITVTLLVPQPEDKVVFLDVGQGDSILIQKGTQQVLVDGGQGMAVLRRLKEELPLFDRKIDVVIATHPDRDHLEGIVHVIERYEVGLVLLPQMPSGTQLQATWLTELKELVERKQVAYRFGWAGQELELDRVKLSILGPFRDGDPTSPSGLRGAGKIIAPGNKTNNAAVLTRVDYGSMSFLLTSDAETPVEKMLVEKYKGSGTLNSRFLTPSLDVDVLKAGHHGSKTSTTAELLAAASPSAVVVSVGADNRYGHPHPTVMDRLKDLQVWRTDQDGSVQFIAEGGQWLVRTH